MDPQDSAQDIVRCDLCETPVPPMCCDICHINLCKACVGEHLSDRSKEHKVVPFEELGCTINFPKCKRHSPKICELYCAHCNIPICASCISSGDHEHHKKVDILRKITSKKKLIKKDLEELKKLICPKFQQALNEIKQVILDQQKLLNSNDVCLVSEYTSRNEEFKSLLAQFQVTLPTSSPQEINGDQRCVQQSEHSRVIASIRF